MPRLFDQTSGTWSMFGENEAPPGAVAPPSQLEALRGNGLGGTAGIVAPGWMGNGATTGSLIPTDTLFGPSAPDSYGLFQGGGSFTPEEQTARTNFLYQFPEYGQIGASYLNDDGGFKPYGTPGGFINDPSQVINDPTYGQITPLSNFGYAGSKGGHGDAIKALLAMAGAAYGFNAMGAEGGGSLFGSDSLFGGNMFNGYTPEAFPGIDYGAGAGAGFPGMTELATFAPTSSGGGIWEEIMKKYSLKDANPWSTGLNVLSGLYGLKQSGDIAKAGREASARMDPFGPQRAQYQQQLSALMANPSSISNTPGYKAGLDAVERKMASQGYIGSGNMMAALQEYGGNVYNQEANRLAMLAGANIGPGGGNVEVNALTQSAEASSKALATLGFSVKQIAQILGRT